MRHINPQLCAQLSSISLLLIFVSTSYGQIPIPPGRVPQGIPNREQALADLRTSVILPERDFEREKRILLVSLKEDFRQLQIINNKLMSRTFEPASNAAAISLEEIRASLGEIQGRARRLKTNFGLPDVKTDKRAKASASGAGTLSAGLLVLDKTVMKFVANPIFRQLQVLDAELSVQAAEDLKKILDLTDSLRKLAKQDPKK